MSQLDTVRVDIEGIINESNEFGSKVTYIKVDKIYDDDNSLNSKTETEYEIVVNVHPENTEELKVDQELGQLIFGKALIFFKYQYVINDTTNLIPRNDDLIIINGIRYRIIHLKPWFVNTGVGYYEGKLVREDLN